MLETSNECAELLENFLDRLEDIQERVENLDGAGFGCFPWYSSYDAICAAPGNSPMCKVCQGLHEYKLVTEWREDQ